MTTRLIISAILSLLALAAPAQQATGLTGLLHTPSALTAPAGSFSVGAHWLDSHATPYVFNYGTGQFYAALTPFSWVQMSYSIILMKDGNRYSQKDQAFSVKLQPLKEGRWYPALAVGGNDIVSTIKNSNSYQCYWYAAATKTFAMADNKIAATLSWRHWRHDYNRRWNGLNGGVEYTPSFCPQITAVAEWTGCDVNVGVNALLWKHLWLQASLMGGRWPSGGVAWHGNLF